MQAQEDAQRAQEEAVLREAAAAERAVEQANAADLAQKAREAERAVQLLREEQERQTKVQQQPAADDGQEEVLVLNVLAREAAGFAGSELLAILDACDCRLGARQIFNRFEQADGQGKVQFSVANLLEPGTFNADMQRMATSGLCFFMRLPGADNPVEAYNCMVETAQCVARNLNGALKDDSHSTVTEQTLAHGRQRIREFQRRALLRV